MLKQFSLLALLCAAFSLNASLDQTGAGAPKIELQLALAPREALIALTNDIIEYLLATEEAKQEHLKRVTDHFQRRLRIEFSVNGIYPGSEAKSMVEYITEEIEEAQEKLAGENDAEKKAEYVERIDRLENIRALLFAHADQHGFRLVKPENELKKDANKETAKGPLGGSSKRDDGSSNTGNGKGFISKKIGKKLILFAGMLGLGYIVWRKFLATSAEDKK